MKFPKKCPNCEAKWFGDEPFRSYLFVRTDLDFDSEDEEDGRIEDQIYECSECHTLFRARWKLTSFVELEEKP